MYRRSYAAMVRLAAVLLDDDHAAEEVTQDAFLAVDGHLAGVAPDARHAYLRRAVVNEVRSRARRAGRTKRRPVPLRVVEDSPEDVAVRDGETERVLAAVRALPDRQRECVVLRYYAQLGEREIADALGVSGGSVKTHLHRALRTLEAVLGEVEEAGAAESDDGGVT
ncbi:MAG: sigma-70 family RNA polymerase sigma factor [Acidimicrobiia bacterium]|nr:sigma-70 family RNA polymerase sigma factor [Acidimicrobiia bacterium]